MADSNRVVIPSKPYPDFPLTPRRDGRWCKRIKGTLYTFPGSAQDALAEYNRVRDDLYAGRKPRTKSDGLTILELCTKFLEAKQQQQQAGEITLITWRDYRRTCKLTVSHFGQSRAAADLAPEDFEGFRRELSKTRKIVAMGNEIRRARVLFKYGYDSGLLATPIRFGPLFKQPTAKALKRLRAQNRSDGTNKDFTAAEIHKLLKYATPQQKAMILLGVNCGFGNHDCARLTLSSVNLETGWVSFARPKTGAPRRCPLWPETTAALRASLAERKEPKSKAHSGLVFITAHSGSFHKDHGSQAISHLFSDLADDCGLKRKGRGFYSLRHVFRTQAGGAKDIEATRSLMGHDESAVEDAYIEGIADDRLLAVSNHVRSWLFAEIPPGTKAAKSKSNRQKPTKEPSKAPALDGSKFQLRIVG